MIIAGHVLALKLPFANGAPCNSKRPFLVINKNNNTLDLLNISSTRGKEKKLLYKSNEKIRKFFPPLDQPSFVKLDELYTIDEFHELHKSIYKNRDPIDTNEYDRILEKFSIYKATNSVLSVKYIEQKVKEENTL
ncbi:hypothetical protein MKY30_23785 [Oceanobacillus sp. FSL W8-0428]|uniref:hypothetical protein n=1 Tax=Oceanobacillus sp. FSL W8-0428 TaxID=2921715 RepID=UPI0030FC07E8